MVEDARLERNSFYVGSSCTLSSTTKRVVTTGSKTGDDFGDPDRGCDIVFDGAKDRTGDDLDDFSFCSVDDKEQHL